jgi:hypothetical protein
MTQFALTPRRALLGLCIILLVAGSVIAAAMRRTSTTFDEIVMIAGGARGYEIGEWDLAPEHPPLVQYLYGTIVHLAHPRLPNESASTPEMRASMGYRYRYAQQLFFRELNDPEQLAFLGRLPAVLCALGLIAVVFFFTRRIAGDAAALVAAGLTAILPDVLGHGGVAYNDVPLALAFVSAIWCADRVIRTPSLLRAIAAGCLFGLALGVKNSAVALAPIAVVLIVWEGVQRRTDRAWLGAMLIAVPVTLLTTYLTLVTIYRGDFALTEYRYALDFAFGHVTQKAVPAYLLGAVGYTGWWYFFPVVFFLKTSAGFHALAGLAGVFFISLLVESPRRVLHSRLRAPFVGLVIFGVLLLVSDLNIGFRYALPALPLLCILTGAGAVGLWRRSERSMRAIISVAGIWAALHVASYYPFFLSYLSEYGPGRDEGYRVLADSSLDWGQGLLELRDFMREHDIPSVYLSYFGSAIPEGYGIQHVPMLSYFPLLKQPPLPAAPKWIAVSATNLTGTYFAGDPYKAFRDARPSYVIGHTIFLYPLE